MILPVRSLVMCLGHLFPLVAASFSLVTNTSSVFLSLCLLTAPPPSGPHLQADEKRQLYALPALQCVPGLANGEEESKCRHLGGSGVNTKCRF